jgi:hypothetical protein
MKRLPLIAAIAALVLLIPALALARAAPETYMAELKSMNGSGVSATAWLTVDGGQVNVHIEEAGLEAGKPHPQHVHGKLPGDVGASPTLISKCPAPSRDSDGDGLVSFAEGLPDYGAVLINLGAPVANADGSLTVDGSFATTSDLGTRAVVIHGLTVDGAYVPSLPVACGQVHRIGG